MTWPTEQAREAVVAYLEEHSFDDAQCAKCGTVRWKHAAHFLDFLAPLIAAREAAAWDEGFHAGHEAARAVNPEWPNMPTNPYQGADDDRD